LPRSDRNCPEDFARLATSFLCTAFVQRAFPVDPMRLPDSANTHLCALLMVASVCANAQVAERLSQVRKLYVDSLGTGHSADEMRQQLVRQLRKSHDIQVVSDPKIRHNSAMAGGNWRRTE
jgi:hypothetical protein